MVSLSEESLDTVARYVEKQVARHRAQRLWHALELGSPPGPQPVDE